MRTARTEVGRAVVLVSRGRLLVVWGQSKCAGCQGSSGHDQVGSDDEQQRRTRLGPKGLNLRDLRDGRWSWCC